MNRLPAIDLLRGLIMVFMALDHASFMIGRMHFTEFWGVDFFMYPDWAWWFTRFVSHLCAPGFFFLMGMSMSVFALGRRADWSAGQKRNYFLKRGLFIWACMLFLEIPAWAIGALSSQVHMETIIPGMTGQGMLAPTTVLFGLGACMMVAAFLWQLQNGWLAMIALLSVALPTVYTYAADPNESIHLIEGLLLLPGITHVGLSTIYPIMPWLGITCLGMIWGRMALKMPEDLPGLSLKIGVGMLIFFVIIRLLGIGNFQYDEYANLMEFFTLIKYPAGLAFILSTCGVNLILYYVFSTVNAGSWSKPLQVYGRTAFFYYIVHLYLYAIIGLAFRGGTEIYVMYGLWLLGLVPLYYMCRAWQRFKSGKPASSLWRMM